MLQRANRNVHHEILSFLQAAIFVETVGTSALKSCEQFTRPRPSLVAYLEAFYLLSLTLYTILVGTVYVVWSDVGIVLIPLIGFFPFRQALDAAAIAVFCRS